MSAKRDPGPPAIQRTFRLLPALKPHTPDLSIGLDHVSDPRLLGSLTTRLRNIIDRGGDAPKSKLRLPAALDARLQDLASELKGIVRPEIAVYELVNAALLAARFDRLAPTYTRRLPLPDETGGRN